MAEENGVVCAGCGRVNPRGMRFCGHCGAALSSSPLVPEPSAPVVPETAVPAAPTPPIAVGAPVTESPRPGSERRAGVGGDIPADPIARERERERLLTYANSLRVKGQITDARETLEKALLYTQGIPPRDVAPIQEQIGDLLEVEEQLEAAAAAYATAHELDPKRVSAEKKYATLSLRLAEKKSGQNLADAMARGDSIADLVATGALSRASGKRNAGVAMLLSACFPGFGQIYNGQLIKGLILLGVYLFSLLIFSLSPEREDLFRSIVALFALKPGKMAHALSPLLVIFAVIALATWLYSIVDAPFFAGKAGATSDDRPKVDKSGWEV